MLDETGVVQGRGGMDVPGGLIAIGRVVVQTMQTFLRTPGPDPPERQFRPSAG